MDQRHPMYGLTAAPSRLKSGKSFLRTVPPLDKHTTHQLKTQNLWQNYTDNIPDQHKLQNFPVQEALPPGHKLQWNKWRCLNRLRSGVGKTKSLLLKWGYLPPGTDYHLPVWKRKSNHEPFVNLRKNWNNLHHG